MQFEWDEQKRQKLLSERGIDLVHAALIFENDVLTKVDNRADYGETRHISLGLVENECFVVIHTDRHDTVRLITAWKGGRDEREQYEESIA